MKQLGWILSFLLCTMANAANNNIVNIYTWSEEIPYRVIEQFEAETGIQVNYSSFDSNEVMFAKLRTNSKGYDIIEPSSYYIEKMHAQDMLEQLDLSKLPNYQHLDPFFLNQSYDTNHYSFPFIWGVTGIFYNKDYFKPENALSWSDLMNKNLKNQLMLLSEARTVFSMAFRMLGFSVNDNHPEHIKKAYLKLKELLPNVRLFNSDAVISILIDEDATIGMAWNGDVNNAKKENPSLEFVFPKDGFEIWVDHFVLLKNAPHRENAYRFLNFLMRPDIAKSVSLSTGYATANLTARKNMPKEIQENPILYPSYAVLQHGEFQSDVGNHGAILEKYWQLLKMG